MSFDYETSPITVLQDDIRVARKPHTCDICGFPISRGDSYRYFFVKDYDKLPPRCFSSHQHFSCPQELKP